MLTLQLSLPSKPKQPPIGTAKIQKDCSIYG